MCYGPELEGSYYGTDYNRKVSDVITYVSDVITDFITDVIYSLIPRLDKQEYNNL